MAGFMGAYTNLLKTRPFVGNMVTSAVCPVRSSHNLLFAKWERWKAPLMVDMTVGVLR
jgi:hypothetical protein